MYKRQIYGLQRSGTNFLEQLVSKNFDVQFVNNNTNRNHPLQKHFRLYDQKEIIPEPQYKNDLIFTCFNDYLKALGATIPIDAILVISKDPYSWLKSYQQWSIKCGWSAPNHHYLEEYNLFYRKWVNFAEEDSRIVLIRYLDLLVKPKEILKGLQQKNKLRPKFWTKLFGIKTTTSKVPMSNHFLSKNRNYYLNEEYLADFKATELATINQLMDLSLLKDLKYKG